MPDDLGTSKGSFETKDGRLKLSESLETLRDTHILPPTVEDVLIRADSSTVSSWGWREAIEALAKECVVLQVCGNCNHLAERDYFDVRCLEVLSPKPHPGGDWNPGMQGVVSVTDHCHYDPSSWKLHHFLERKTK